MDINIRDEDLIRIHLKARELYERALVCSFTSPTKDVPLYEERMITVKMAVVDLLKTLGMEVPK